MTSAVTAAATNTGRKATASAARAAKVSGLGPAGRLAMTAPALDGCPAMATGGRVKRWGQRGKLEPDECTVLMAPARDAWEAMVAGGLSADARRALMEAAAAASAASSRRCAAASAPRRRARPGGPPRRAGAALA
jgi:hypothetical protein